MDSRVFADFCSSSCEWHPIGANQREVIIPGDRLVETRACRHRLTTWIARKDPCGRSCARVVDEIDTAAPSVRRPGARTHLDERAVPNADRRQQQQHNPAPSARSWRSDRAEAPDRAAQIAREADRTRRCFSDRARAQRRDELIASGQHGEMVRPRDQRPSIALSATAP